jgi:hypothetical protein
LENTIASIIAKDNGKADGEHAPRDQIQALGPELQEALQQLHLTNGPLPAYHNQQISFENIRYEGPSRKSLSKESSDTSHASTRLNSINIKESNLCGSTINFSSVQELNQETATGRNISDLGDQGHRKVDYSAANFKRERSRPWKRAREAASNRDTMEENDSSYSIKGPRQKKTKGPSNSV